MSESENIAEPLEQGKNGKDVTQGKESKQENIQAAQKSNDSIDTYDQKALKEADEKYFGDVGESIQKDQNIRIAQEVQDTLKEQEDLQSSQLESIQQQEGQNQAVEQKVEEGELSLDQLNSDQLDNKDTQAINHELYETVNAEKAQVSDVKVGRYDSNQVEVSVGTFTPQALSPFSFPVQEFASFKNQDFYQQQFKTSQKSNVAQQNESADKEAINTQSDVPKVPQPHIQTSTILQQEILQQSQGTSQGLKKESVNVDDSFKTHKEREQSNLVELYRKDLYTKLDQERVKQFEDSKNDFFFSKKIDSKSKYDLLARLQYQGAENIKNSADTDDISALQMNIMRHQSMCESHVKNAEQETQVNQELSIIFLQKLESGLRQLEIIAEIVKRLQVGEDFYSKVLEQCGFRIPSQNGASKNMVHDTTSEAVAAMKILLQNLSYGHSTIFKGLRSQQIELDMLILLYKEALKNISQFSNLAHKNLQSSRQRLSTSLGEYESSIINAENMMNLNKGLYTLAGIEKDPWEIECQVVKQHYILHQVQFNERQYLKSAFLKVENLEQQRIHQTQLTVQNWLKEYFKCTEALGTRGDTFQARITQINQDSDLTSFRSTGQSSEDTAMKLEARDQQTLWDLFVGLLGSHEIVKQGQLSVLQEDHQHQHSNKGDSQELTPQKTWKQLHFVLTRSGFMYGKNTMEDILPQHGYSIPLSKSQLVQSDAPEFQITIRSGGSLFRRQVLKLTFKSESIEECTEWIMCIKDAISSFKKQ